MRRYCVLACAIVGLLAVCLGAQAQQESKGVEAKSAENRKMLVDNRSGIRVISIQILPSGNDCCWSRNLVEPDGIPPDAGRVVEFDDGSGKCNFDIWVDVEAKGRDLSYLDFNVCREVQIRVY